jgi:hypothetical protein
VPRQLAVIGSAPPVSSRDSLSRMV